jgi:hypothetical protein
MRIATRFDVRREGPGHHGRTRRASIFCVAADPSTDFACVTNNSDNTRSLYERALAVKDRTFTANHPKLAEIHDSTESLRAAMS